ncbi:MAG: ECF transporter S component [Oscillospiraceae bacterium]|nr:ECF transporter S component [Oscillospiraceae bacterium]
MSKSIKKLTFSALFLALCLVLPFLTGQIPQIGQMLSPMHIPVLLCGFVCGWGWGLAVGFIAPLLRSVLFGMPALYPTAVAMAFELAAYGALAGILYKTFPKKIPYIYLTLILSMIGGRIVWGIVDFILLSIGGSQLTMEMFLSAVVLKSVPGIILHIVLIPLIVIALQKAKLVLNDD